MFVSFADCFDGCNRVLLGCICIVVLSLVSHCSHTANETLAVSQNFSLFFNLHCISTASLLFLEMQPCDYYKSRNWPPLE